MKKGITYTIEIRKVEPRSRDDGRLEVGIRSPLYSPDLQRPLQIMNITDEEVIEILSLIANTREKYVEKQKNK